MTCPSNPTPAALAALLDTFEIAVRHDEHSEHDHYREHVTEARAALLAAARQGEEDKARLDWMQSRCAQLSVPDYPRVWDVTPDGGAYHFTPLTCAGPTDLREALDAARAASQPQEGSRG